MQHAIMKKLNRPFLLLAAATVAVGLFNDYLALLFSLPLTVCLIVVTVKNRRLSFHLNATMLFAAVLPVCYLLSVIWAVDRGMAVFGFFKFLPLPLFLLLCRGEGVRTEEVLAPLPYLMGGLTVITAVLMQIPALATWFSVAGRLSGTFQYANTYALLCLVCVILLLAGENVRLPQFVTSLVLLFGILYSGSRTVFVLTALTAVVLLFRLRRPRLKLYFALASVAAVGLFFGYAVLTGNTDTIRRLFSLSVYESTFAGRILYWADALSALLRHPFGMGYMGYYFAQASFKTGVYSVMFTHNDLLQLALDVGFVPLALWGAAVVQTLRRREVSFARKLALGVFTLHACFDFDLQFVAVFLVYLLLLDWDGGKERALRSVGGACVAAGAVALCAAYFGMAALFQYAGKAETALALYPQNTLAQIQRLPQIEDLGELEATADAILARNDYVALAYDAKARCCYARGDFAEVIRYKRLAIERNYYDRTEYEDLCRMLLVGIDLYRKNGDTFSADYCAKELARVPRYIADAEDKLSTLGRRIQDQPDLTLSAELVAHIEERGVTG